MTYLNVKRNIIKCKCKSYACGGADMKKKIISGILALLTGVMLIGCGANTKTTTENTKRHKR